MKLLYNICCTIRDKFNSFMYGRNGIDRLNRGLIWIYLILFILTMFSGAKTLNYVIDAIMVVMMIVILCRAFSRNIAKRREECDKWSAFWWRFRTGNVDKNLTYKQSFRYITCERCNTVCRVPAGKGKIIVTCPKCYTKIPTET